MKLISKNKNAMIVVLHVSNRNVYHVTLLNRITGFIAFKENNIDKISPNFSINLLLKFMYLMSVFYYVFKDLKRFSELITDRIQIKSYNK